MSFVLIISLLIVYIFNIARTPLITRIVKHDKNVLIYSVRNISPVQYCSGISSGYLQYKENNQWVYVRPKEEEISYSVLLCLRGFGRGKYEFKVIVGPLKKGEYRIEKVFYRE